MRSIETDELTPSTHAGAELASISEAAADWFLRARDRRFTPAEEKALARWFRQSPRHVAEFLRVYQLHGLLREAKLERLELEREREELAGPRATAAGNKRARMPRIVALLAIALAIAIGVGMALAIGD
jgi:transmembrane sensor